MPYFDEKHIAIIENEIRSEKNVALKSRRNKKYVSGNALYRSYVSQNCKNLTVLQKLLSEITREQILLTSDVISYFVADCALQLFGQKPLFFQYLQGKISIGKYDILLDALIGDRQRAMDFCGKYPAFFRTYMSVSRMKTFWDLYIFPVKIWEAGKRAVRIIHPQKL